MIVKRLTHQIQIWTAHEMSQERPQEQSVDTEQPLSFSDPFPMVVPHRQRISRRRVLKIGACLAAFGVGAAWGWHNGRHSFVYRGHRAAVNGVAWSPDGKRLASCSRDGATQVWDARNGGNASSNYLLTTKWTDQDIPVTAVAWSPDSTRIAITSAAGDVFVWRDSDDASWMVAEATPHSPAMNALAWSPDGGRIAAACADGTVQIWNGLDTQLFWPNAPASLVYRNHHAAVTTVVWSPDGGRIASGAKNGTLAIWDASTGITDKEEQIEHGDILVATKPLSLHPAAITGMAWQPAGGTVLYTDETGWFELWSANPKNTTEMNGMKLWEEQINAVAWSPDGGRFALGLQSGAIEIWSSSTVFAPFPPAPLARYTLHSQAVTALAWSPDGRAIASASADTTVHISYLQWWR